MLHLTTRKWGCKLSLAQSSYSRLQQLSRSCWNFRDLLEVPGLMEVPAQTAGTFGYHWHLPLSLCRNLLDTPIHPPLGDIKVLTVVLQPLACI
jgi:hypothetical protein